MDISSVSGFWIWKLALNWKLWKGSWLFRGAIASASCSSILVLFLWMLNSTLLTAPVSLHHGSNPHWLPLWLWRLLWQLWPSGFLHLSTTTWLLLLGGSIIPIGYYQARPMTASTVSLGLYWRAITELLSDTTMLLPNTFLMAHKCPWSSLTIRSSVCCVALSILPLQGIGATKEVLWISHSVFNC